MLLVKSKLHSIEVLILKALIESVTSHDEFVLINNVLKLYNEIKEEIKNQLIKDFSIFIKQCHHIIVWIVGKIQNVKIKTLQKQKTKE